MLLSKFGVRQSGNVGKVDAVMFKDPVVISCRAVIVRLLNSKGAGLWKCAEMIGSRRSSESLWVVLEVQFKLCVVEEGSLSIFNIFMMREVEPRRRKRERWGRWIVRTCGDWVIDRVGRTQVQGFLTPDS